MGMIKLDKKFIHFTTKTSSNLPYGDWYYDPESNEIYIERFDTGAGTEKFLAGKGSSTWGIYFENNDDRAYALRGYNIIYKELVFKCVLARLNYFNLKFLSWKELGTLNIFLNDDAEDAVFNLHFHDVIRLEKKKVEKIKSKYKYDGRKRAKKRNRR